MAFATSCSAVLAFSCWSLRGPLLAGRRCLRYRSSGFWFLTYFGVPFKVRFLCRDVLVSCLLALPYGFHVEPLGSLDSLAPSGEPAGVNRFHSSSHNTSIMCVRSSTFHDGDGGGDCICSSCTLSFGGIRPSYVISHMWASSVG